MNLPVGQVDAPFDSVDQRVFRLRKPDSYGYRCLKRHIRRLLGSDSQ